MEPGIIVFLAAAALSYVYAFVSGFTDASNAVATAVGTRALTPLAAVVVAAVFELVGALTGTAVAETIGTRIAGPEVVSPLAVVAALLATLCWSLLTYRLGLPVSETHGLVGALVGVGLFAGGAGAVRWGELVPVLAAIVVSPALGVLGGIVLVTIVYAIFHDLRRDRASRLFRDLQRLSSVFMAFSHGRNDAQKPMGILALALAVSFGWRFEVPLWVVVSVAAAAGLGVAAGGWRIIRTLGMRVTGLRPEQGFAAQTSAAAVLQLASAFGVPVSTTQTVTSAIVGVGIARGWSAVHWPLVGEIAISWALTLPATVLLGYGSALALQALFGAG